MNIDSDFYLYLALHIKSTAFEIGIENRI